MTSAILLCALALGAAALSAASAEAAGPTTSRPVRLTDSQLDAVTAGLTVARVTASATTAGAAAETATTTWTHASGGEWFEVALGTGHARAVGDAPAVELSTLLSADGDAAVAIGLVIDMRTPVSASGHAVALGYAVALAVSLDAPTPAEVIVGGIPPAALPGK